MGTAQQSVASLRTIFSYTSWDPAFLGSNLTLSGSNLVIDNTGAGSTRSVINKSTGLWYWECTITTLMLDNVIVGLCNTFFSPSSTVIGADTQSLGFYSGGGIYKNGSLFFSTGGFVQGDVIGMALDATNSFFKFYKNNTLIYTAAGSDMPNSGSPYYAVAGFNGTASGGKITTNFGASALTYTPPSGYNSGLYL